MHEEYQFLQRKLEPRLGHSPVSNEDIAYVRNMLPPFLVEFLEAAAESLYLDGAIKVCNPKKLAPILTLIFGGDRDFSHRDCAVVSLTAFGNLRVWSKIHGLVRIELAEGNIFCEQLAPSDLLVTPKPPKRKLDDNLRAAGAVYFRKEQAEFLDFTGQPMFERCLRTHGQLALDECYGFFPALGLAGTESPLRRVENVQKVNALEHFSILAQVQKFHLSRVGKKGVEHVREIG